MSHDVIHRLSRPDLEALASDLEAGRIPHPVSPQRLHMVSQKVRAPLAAWLSARADEGLSARHAALMLRMVSEERRAQQAIADRTQLVWTGVTTHGAPTRDTSVVVQEMFASAKRSVVVASYALDYGEKGAAVFGALARRMTDDSALDVHIFVNVPRPHGDDRPTSDITGEFRHRFVTDLWKDHRRPQLYYDTRALEQGQSTRSCLHAKCVIIDDQKAFITSANFTEAAHERNIEAGILISEPSVARGLRDQFEALVAGEVLKRLL